jgi:hypothetical protein
VLVVILAACSGGSSRAKAIDRDGSTRVSAPREVRVTNVLDAYSITYRVETVEDGKVTVDEAALTVQRPFRSRLELGDGSVRVSDFGYLGHQPAKGKPSVYTAAPEAAGGDVRADLVVDDTGREVRPGSGVDECIDADGLVLEEVVRDATTITRRWVATRVDTSPTTRTRDFRLRGVAPIPARDGGGSLQKVKPASAPPGPVWELDAPPPGFDLIGRYAVVPPQDASADDPETRDQVIAGIVDVFMRGHDVVFIEQGGTLGQVPPFGTAENGTVVDLGELARNAEWFPTVTGAEVRALLPPGRYVKVRGTLPADDLIAIARSLHERTGTGLTYIG